VTGVTFSDSDSPPVPKFLNPDQDPGPAILQISESDSCSDSGYNQRSNHNLPIFLLKKWPHRLLLLPKWKSDSWFGSGFSQIFDSGTGSESERKTQNPAGVDFRPVTNLLTRDEHGSGPDRTGSGLKAVLAGSGLDRMAIFWKLADQDWIGLRKFLLYLC